MNSDGKPQGLHLRPHKGTYLVSFYFLDSAQLPFYICHAKDGSGTPEHLNVNLDSLPEESCPKSLARRDLPDETCPTTPDSEAEARQQPSTGSKPPGELCARRPGNIPDGNS
ncbi:hypothetical protein ACFX2I_042773 [Malus domestica]